MGERKASLLRRKRNNYNTLIADMRETWDLDEPSPYQIIKEIGQPSAFGRVYLVEHEETQQRLAMKRIFVKRRGALKDIMRETSVCCLLNGHPNIVKFADAFVAEDHVDLVMQVCTEELFDRIIKKKRLSEKDVVLYTRQIVTGLLAVHQEGLYHGDLKPENLMFTDEQDTQLVLIDYGHTKLAPHPPDKATGITGTRGYQAPEVLREKRYEASVDMFAVGVIVFVMLFGFHPFQTRASKIMKHNASRGPDPFQWMYIRDEVRKGKGPWFPKNVAVSDNARSFILALVSAEAPAFRLTPEECLEHPFLDHKNASDEALPEHVLTQLAHYKATSRFQLNVLDFMTHYLSGMELNAVHRTFNSMDSDQDGVISLEEFKHAMKALPSWQEEFKGQSTAAVDAQIKEMFASADLNSDFELNFHELVQACMNDKLLRSEERMYLAFHDLDQNNNGWIDKEGLMTLLASNAADAKAEEQTLADGSTTKPDMVGKDFESLAMQMLAEVDTNHDGHIDYHEFIAAIQTEFNSNYVAEVKSLASTVRRSNKIQDMPSDISSSGLMAEDNDALVAKAEREILHPTQAKILQNILLEG